ncbi:MAG: YciK family oxidoreductase [Gammaproteobacteria bacterium]|nr:YciK family oxidoreductase [Gammaproteobacteria bacterium]
MRLIDYVAPANLLDGRTIAITGAGDGIGRAVALACGQAGAQVVLMGRTIRKLESVYDQLEQCGAPEPAIYPVELQGATLADYEAFAETLSSSFGKLHGLLHNAGELGSRSPIDLYEPDEFAKVMHVNVTAAFLLTRALLPLLKSTGDGSIVFTSSGVGRKARAYWGAYAISKFATEGMMQVLADELESAGAVRVNSLNPGAVRTNMRANAYPAENPASLVSPAQIAPAYLYLLGPDSRSVHGQALSAQPND